MSSPSSPASTSTMLSMRAIDARGLSLAFDAGLTPSIKSVKMMDRPVTMANTKTIGRRDRGTDKGLGVANGAFKVLVFGKAGGDRRRQRASGAVGVLGRNAWRRQCEHAVAAHEIIDA